MLFFGAVVLAVVQGLLAQLGKPTQVEVAEEPVLARA
jgi:hypothetical protein